MRWNLASPCGKVGSAGIATLPRPPRKLMTRSPEQGARHRGTGTTPALRRRPQWEVEDSSFSTFYQLPGGVYALSKDESLPCRIFVRGLCFQFLRRARCQGLMNECRGHDRV